MAETRQEGQAKSQDAPIAKDNSPQVPIDLEQTVRGMMQQLEVFKWDSRLQHLFPREETPNKAYDVPRPPAQSEVQLAEKGQERGRSQSRSKKRRHHRRSPDSSSFSTSGLNFSS